MLLLLAIFLSNIYVYVYMRDIFLKTVRMRTVKISSESELSWKKSLYHSMELIIIEAFRLKIDPRIQANRG